MFRTSRWFEFPGVLCIKGAIAFGTVAALSAPSVAQEKTGPVNFFLWNTGPGSKTFDEGQWMAAIASLSLQSPESVSLFSDDPEEMLKVLDDAKVADPPESVIVLTTFRMSTADAAVFADKMKMFDDVKDDTPDMVGSAILVDTPLCRVMQLALKPTEYAPTGLVITGSDPDAMGDCYRQAAEVHFRRSQGWDLDADGNRIVAVDTAAEHAQDMMPSAISTGWLLADTNDPDRRKKRDSSIFARGDEIVIRTTLDYVRRRGAGYPGAQFEIELDVEIRKADGTLFERLEDLYRYEGEVQHQVPVDADYFSNWIVASVRINQPGAYKVVFLLTDRMAPEDKQIPVPIEVDVTVE
jgi:hypothetical protein